MRIEKTVTIAAPIQKAWDVLLDPAAIGGCIPGVESVEALDPTHFVVAIAVKIGVVRARFKMTVTIIETRPPWYLKSQGVGEESSLTSSLRQSTELELKERGANETELRIVTDVDVFGALGTFGYSVMKTKADRMWDQFITNLKTRME